MRVLLDNNVTQKLAAYIDGHEVVHVRQVGWARLENGRLLTAAEEHAFDVLVTADKGMAFQQNMRGRIISVILLRSVRMTIRHLTPLVPTLLEALEQMPRGAILAVSENGVERWARRR